jgi:hypothetical protein
MGLYWDIEQAYRVDYMRVVSPDVSRVYMADNRALVRRTTSGLKGVLGVLKCCIHGLYKPFEGVVETGCIDTLKGG